MTTVVRTRLAHWLLIAAFLCFLVAAILFIPGVRQDFNLPWLVPAGLACYIASLLAPGA